MSERQIDADAHAKEWVSKAEQDYRTAVALEPTDVPDVVCFHCQQCVKKYLKATVAAYTEPVPRTHDLTELNKRAEVHEHSLARIYEALDTLNPYSVLIRYPGYNATVNDAESALDAMKRARAVLRRTDALSVLSE